MREVGRALSRYDGCTVYSRLATILSVPASSLFADDSSCYASALIGEVEDKGIGRISARDNVSHGIALGFLYRAVLGGPKTTRIAPSILGRAYRAAIQIGDDQFREFVVTGAILDRDFDMYGIFLTSALENAGNRIDKADFRQLLRSQFEERRNWFVNNIPSPIVREEIQTNIQWMNPKRRRRRVFPGTTAEHRIQPVNTGLEPADKSIDDHFHLRWEWARHMGHMDGKTLTPSGRKIAILAQSVANLNSMFWLAPTLECAKRVGIVSKLPETVFSGWDLLRPDGAEQEPDDQMAHKVANFMESAFNAIRLRAFAQAPLATVILYVYFQEAAFGRKVNARKLFQKIMKERRETMNCMLLGILEDSQYRLRKVSLSAPVPRV